MRPFFIFLLITLGFRYEIFFHMPYGISLESILVAMVSMFTIINPIGATPFFVGHTESLSLEQKKHIARKASFASAVALTFFALFGTFLFKFMGITLPAFRIAGGVLVFSSAWNMLKGSNVRSRTLPEEQQDAESKEDISIIPLAIPLLSGPGAISTIMVLEAKTTNWAESAVIIFAAASICFVTYFILVNSTLLVKVIGPSGIRVMNRILGLLLSAISIQFVINGIKDLIPEFVKLTQI